MCYSDLGRQPEIVLAEVVAEPPRQSLSEWFFAILTILAIGFVIVVGIGVALQEPIQGLVFAVIVAVPLAAVAVQLQNKKAKQGGISWAERFATLMLTAAVTMGILGGLAVAGVVALIAVCFVALSSGGFR